MTKPAYEFVLADIDNNIKLAENANTYERANANAQIAIAKSLMAIYAMFNEILTIAKEQR